MRNLLVALFSLSPMCVWAAPDQQWLVVEEKMESVACCSFHGAPDADLAARNIRLVFTPSEVVFVLKRDGNKALIRGHSGVSAWLENPKLVGPKSFKPVTSWDGQSQFDISSASYDSGQTYKFAKDGTFSASFDDNHDPRKWLGRLHKYKQLVWAKPQGGNAAFDSWSLFQLKDDLTACILYFDEPPSVQCVGSMQ